MAKEEKIEYAARMINAVDCRQLSESKCDPMFIPFALLEARITDPRNGRIKSEYRGSKYEKAYRARLGMPDHGNSGIIEIR